MVLLLEGVPLPEKVSEGGRLQGGGVSIFYAHKKWSRTKQNIFRAIPPPPWMPLLRNSPLLPWKTSNTLWGSTHFWQRLRGGYQNFTMTPSDGGYAFNTGTFPEKDHPHPPYEKFWTVPKRNIALASTDLDRTSVVFVSVLSFITMHFYN